MKVRNLFTICLLLSLVLYLYGCEENIPTTTCQDCTSEFPELYAISDSFGRELCPECSQKLIVDHANQQEEMRDDIVAYGQYVFDDEDYIVFERSMCFHCGNNAPFNLRLENEECLCIDCATEILCDSKVSKAAWKYLQG